jgi:hypothetical protein
MAIENVGLAPSIFDTAKDLVVIVFLKNFPKGVLYVTQSGENNWIGSSVNGGTTSATTIDGYRVLTVTTATHGVQITVKRTSPLFTECLKVFNQQQQFPSLTDQNGSIWLYSASTSLVQHFTGVAFLNTSNGWALNADRKIQEVTLSFDATNLSNASYGVFKTAFDVVQGLLSETNNELMQKQVDLKLARNYADVAKQQEQITRQYANLNATIGQTASKLAQQSYDIAKAKGLAPEEITPEVINGLPIGQLADSPEVQKAMVEHIKKENNIK